jgi:hypothetical protein
MKDGFGGFDKRVVKTPLGLEEYLKENGYVVRAFVKDDYEGRVQFEIRRKGEISKSLVVYTVSAVCETVGYDLSEGERIKYKRYYEVKRNVGVDFPLVFTTN